MMRSAGRNGTQMTESAGRNSAQMMRSRGEEFRGEYRCMPYF